MGYIYYFKNLLNNKIYIGKTINNPKRRYYEHTRVHINDGTVFHNALKKYGEKNFLFYVIGEFENDKLNEMEQYYIKKFNSHWKDGYGYNMSYGGENSPDVLEKRVRAYPLDDEQNPIYDKKQDFKSLSECARCLTEQNGIEFYTSNIINICKGRKYSHRQYTFCYLDDDGEEVPTNYIGLKGAVAASKENIKKCHEKNSIPVIAITPTNEEYYFSGIRKAAKELHVDSKNIRKSINNQEVLNKGNRAGWRFRLATEEEKLNEDNFCKKVFFTNDEALQLVEVTQNFLENYNLSFKKNNELVDINILFDTLVQKIAEDCQTINELFETRGEN